MPRTVSRARRERKTIALARDGRDTIARHRMFAAAGRRQRRQQSPRHLARRCARQRRKSPAHRRRGLPGIDHLTATTTEGETRPERWPRHQAAGISTTPHQCAPLPSAAAGASHRNCSVVPWSWPACCVFRAPKRRISAHFDALISSEHPDQHGPNERLQVTSTNARPEGAQSLAVDQVPEAVAALDTRINTSSN